jgi:uncharacterized CHY-type Zn-finger protein
MPRLHKSRQSEPDQASSTIGYNADRDKCLYWRTEEGYIIAQDVNCQHEYVNATPCANCGGPLRVVAHINRAGQGLSEIVAMCGECRQRTSYIFDISNDVFQRWWAEQLGPLYVRQFEDAPREPFAPE